MLQISAERNQVFMLCYDSLEELLDWWAPDCWQLDQHWISDDVCKIDLCEKDFRFTVWIASLSLDGRWTLSPVHGPWQTSLGPAAN